MPPNYNIYLYERRKKREKLYLFVDTGIYSCLHYLISDLRQI